MIGETQLIWVDWHQGFTELFCLLLHMFTVFHGEKCKKKKTYMFSVSLHIPSPNLICSVGSLNSQGCYFYYSSNRIFEQALSALSKQGRRCLLWEVYTLLGRPPACAQNSCTPQSRGTLTMEWITKALSCLGPRLLFTPMSLPPPHLFYFLDVKVLFGTRLVREWKKNN